MPFDQSRLVVATRPKRSTRLSPLLQRGIRFARLDHGRWFFPALHIGGTFACLSFVTVSLMIGVDAIETTQRWARIGAEVCADNSMLRAHLRCSDYRCGAEALALSIERDAIDDLLIEMCQKEHWPASLPLDDLHRDGDA